ncbi:hypothetical protein U9K52_09875 [Chryseobacterium sp. MHB01]|uniref:hypothetical protein n=1 Tax=Chryseobacterium sp. MHB01 TaxID=3109433 RepID=UPI002AFF1919|nr:hypothetical protein [Chryseobacterium sp. MHB01]MEA1849220.1 hypothetical protein [Chryseobacterium sp. MHB01]
MKKLFFASIVMLAMLTACNNAESTTTPEEQQNQTFAGKTDAIEGDEKEEAAEAEIIIQKDMEAGGGTDTSRILCHTPYGNPSGHACVKVNNHLFNVSWEPSIYGGIGGVYQSDPDEGGIKLNWTSTLASSCNCR